MEVAESLEREREKGEKRTWKEEGIKEGRREGKHKKGVCVLERKRIRSE